MRTVNIPEGRWRYFFDSEEVIEGPVTISRDFPIDEFPAFVREDAIIPLRLERDYTGLGDRDSEGHLTLLIYPNAKNTFIVHRENKESVSITVHDGEPGTRIQIPESDETFIIRLRHANKPSAVKWNDSSAEDMLEWQYGTDTDDLVIRQLSSSAGTISEYF